MQIDNNAIIDNVVNEILLNEIQKVSAAREAPDFLTLFFMITIYIRWIHES